MEVVFRLAGACSLSPHIIAREAGLKASSLKRRLFHYANSLDEIAPRMAFALQGFGKRR